MNDEYYNSSDFKKNKKERKNKMPKNKKTEIRESQKPKNMRLSVMGRKIGENREKIKDMIARFEILSIEVRELVSLFPTESDETEVKEIDEIPLEPETKEPETKEE